MKQFIFLSLFFVLHSISFAQNAWTWISGDSVKNSSGFYGIQGVVSSANKPGARFGSVNATDASGNLYLFGGVGYSGRDSGYLNDLWRYAPSTGLWTWIGGDSGINQPGVYNIKGVASALGKPKARYYAVSWTDASGNLWLYGGTGSGYFNDLWKYDHFSNQWTWISGDSIPGRTSREGIYGIKGKEDSANTPGARALAVSWVDASGNFWMFGGYGFVRNGEGALNDLWKYSPATGMWTWISGDSSVRMPNVYGVQGVAASTNKPGSKYASLNWIDQLGNFWLFGGVYNNAIGGGFTNDLWKYVPSDNQWTWISGDTVTYQPGVYGSLGMPTPSNKPGSRDAGITWTDNAGNLWMFSGYYYNPNGNSGNLNDIWKYSPSFGQWTWMGGDSSTDYQGVYGIRGIASSDAKPGGRSEAARWIDVSGRIWIFGGDGVATNGHGSLNDLWEYSISNIPLPVKFDNFSIRELQQNVQLNWTIKRGDNFRNFIVERSSTGMLYDSIGNVSVTDSSSNSDKKYSFIDKSPLFGNNFYRIKEIDLDGSFTNSAVVKIMRREIAQLIVIHNPVHGDLKLHVQLPDRQNVNLQIRDMNGHLVLNEDRLGTEGSNMYSIAVGHLFKGVYIISMRTGSTNSTKTFIKP